uniref:Uncharacterized protein n=1 Tax=Proboscia inermis TaxID=420281 RepID=A0A7S0GIG9_9STRA|mmetsp:Transcript_38463/g.38872  ORF Transcript_38463/g.38872 Transcript_38463/m.38872 type:complete len:293 (+) Transcript_38463:118-996(+)|eukprot:CAMPEP_0171321490 /NCGR_PEP_ID=MMETSP0816-20121228/112580_1 /TAXON_ID=420281 /ORGANISM="Proboscia inermis, Strain CCAP1064/1" /LENGTH=292 /DNA_ID=CAMNT_0011819537 /DNA_START=103 /DNA_END=981 /DNA_ORIENTATION=+
MPKLIGKAVRVVEIDGLAIDECTGNVSTSDDTLSVAHVHVAEPGSEPWLTLHYDEWLCIRKGMLEVHYGDGEVLNVNEGETAFISKGERFRPVFPVGGLEYIAICSPAFRPDRCIREEEGISDVSLKLQSLHTKENGVQLSGGNSGFDDVDNVLVLYHMCEKSLWEKAVASGGAYYPPTFEEDGMYTHATAVPGRLIETGNHFYTGVEGDWICLELNRSALDKIGIKTVFEEAKPVGDTKHSDNWDSEKEDWICPHIFGGIPTAVDGVVTNTFKMARDEKGKFLSIPGVTAS